MNGLVWVGIAIDVLRALVQSDDLPAHQEDLARQTETRAQYVFPDTAYAQMGRLAQSGDPTEAKLSEIKRMLCEGKYKVKYSFEYKPLDTPNMALDDASQARQDDLEAFREYVKHKLLYESSGWVYDGGFYEVGELERTREFRRLYSPHFHDMALLVTAFTYRLDKSELRDPTSTQIQYLGFDPYTEKFSPSKAVENQDTLWAWSLDRTTKVSETDLGQGKVRFTLEWNTAQFCKYSVTVTSLISK